MSQDKYPLKIRYEYAQNPEVRLQYVHGVWGGVTPQGEVEICFYTESDKMPDYAEQIVSEDGSLGHEMVPDNTVKTVERRVHSRVLLNYYTARAVLGWLEDKVEMLERDSNEGAGYFPDDESFRQ